MDEVYKAFSVCYFFLIWWNDVYYRRRWPLKKLLGPQLWRDFNKVFNFVKKYCEEKLITINIDNDFQRELVFIFDMLKSKKSIGSTGASKVLHILNPELFIPRDTKIRKGFGLSGNGASYAKFTVELQRIAKELDEKHGEREILEEHVRSLGWHQLNRNLEPLTKIIDESNFLIFTRVGFRRRKCKVSNIEMRVKRILELLETNLKGEVLERKLKEL